MSNEIAVKIAVKVIKQFEGLNLRAYPDPASPLYKALSLHGMLKKYMDGAILWKDLADNFKALSGAPFTCGYGETQGVTKDTVWSSEEAESRLIKRVEGFMDEVLKASPKLSNESADKLAAVTSLVYNIGITNYRTSTVAKMIAVANWVGAAAGILLWNKAGNPLKIVDGLDKRRKIEAALFMSGVR
jgi:lysozyme